MKIEEEINKFTHEVEETFREVKDHVILTVEQHSLVIALVLMSVTSAILIIGTVYMWCFHHPSRSERSRPAKKLEKKPGNSASSEEPNNIQKQNGEEKNATCKSDENNVVEDLIEAKDEPLDTMQDDKEKVVEARKRVPSTSLDTTQDNNEKVVEVRKRVPSTSGSVNNNESPGKSKIPVRRSISRTKQS